MPEDLWVCVELLWVDGYLLEWLAVQLESNELGRKHAKKVPKEHFCDSLALGWATIIKLDQEWLGPERDQECQSQDFSEKDFANPRFVGFFRDGIFQ